MNRAFFRHMAAYSQWANARLHAAALQLPEETYRRRTGVFFGSLHGTLNHLLLTDRLWLQRLTGVGEYPGRLDAILYESRTDLVRARAAEDARLVETVETFQDESLARSFSYVTTSGSAQEQPLWQILAHLFNHQTHHRGQAHACLSMLTATEPPTLDLLAMQRGASAPDLAALT